MTTMKINRGLVQIIEKELFEVRKIIIVFGARQTGKSTLLEDMLKKYDDKVLHINADELKYVDILSSRDLNRLQLLTEGYDILFIDEAQRIPEIGINLKILFDRIPKLKIIVTGSSSLDIASKTKESLTGRTSTYHLFPISLYELRKSNNPFELQGRLEEFLTFGMYPEVFHYSSRARKEKYLRELASSYLYKDIFDISPIRNTRVLKNLLKLLAYQIGSEVSLNELATSLKISQNTVNTYINLLEENFIVFRLSGFNRNLRKEISKRDKIFFWDVGLRNTLIDNFNMFEYRTDIGALWENFIIAERLKYLSYTAQYANSHFWRTYTGAELDYVEEREGDLFAYELKWRKPKKKAPQTWVDNYSSHFKCITIDNFWEFVT